MNFLFEDETIFVQAEGTPLTGFVGMGGAFFVGQIVTTVNNEPFLFREYARQKDFTVLYYNLCVKLCRLIKTRQA